VRIERADWARITVVAVAGNAGPALLFSIAETELDSAVAGMITSGTPVLALVIASVLLRRLPGRAQAIGIGLGFAGILMMTAPSLSGAQAAPAAVGFVILATIGYGLTSNLIVPLQQKYGGPAVVLWALVISSLMLAPLAVVGIDDSEFSASALLAVVILGVIGTGIVRAMSATLAGRVGGPRMSTTTYFIPVVAIVLGVVFRDEVVHPVAILGVLLVLLGAFFATRAVSAD
jgi:drug/metabolite transporter (DMT)-like permease